MVACTDYSGYDCEGCIFSNCYGDTCLLWGSDSCVDGDWFCRYEQAAIEGK